MITCDKCGFGHKTFEEKRACKSWDEIAAAIQAAGSGAELLTAKDVESSILFSTGTFIDYGIAAASLNRKVRERLSGSPRKVGEDAGRLRIALERAGFLVHRELCGNLAHHPECRLITNALKGHAENCNSALFGGPMGECDCALRPSSAPVGEQK